MRLRRPHLRLGLSKFFGKPNLLSIIMKSVNIFNCSPVKMNHPNCSTSNGNILFEAKTGQTIKQLKFRSYLNCFAVVLQLFQLVMRLNKVTTRKCHNYTSQDIFALFGWTVFAGGTSYTLISRNIAPIQKFTWTTYWNLITITVKILAFKQIKVRTNIHWQSFWIYC